MAILDHQPNLQVSVICDGSPLQEFDHDDREAFDGSVTKYIEATTEAEFAVQFELCKPYPTHAMRIELSIDGKRVRSRIIGKNQYKNRTASVTRVFDEVTSKIKDGQCTMQKFCFSQLQIDDSDSCALEGTTRRELELMGTISLRAYYIHNLRKAPMKERTVDKKRYDIGPISEKILKGRALTHCTGLGTAVNMPYETSLTHTIFDYVDPYRQPFASFHFKYRSKAALQSLLIIPRSPSPEPFEAKNEDIVEIQGFPKLYHEGGLAVRNVKEERGIKRERVASFGSDDDVMFVSARKRPRYREPIEWSGIEIIDLT